MAGYLLDRLCIFSARYITAILHLGTLGSTLVLRLGAILNSEVTNKKHENMNNLALNRLFKYLFTE